MKILFALLTAGVQFVVGREADRTAMFGWYQGLDAKNILYAVSCGSEESFTDVGGITYEADQGFTGGHASSEGQGKKKWSVPNTEVYQSERWNDDDFSYNIPIDLSVDRQVTLVLKFSEIYFQNAGQKVFNVQIGDTFIARDLDPFSRALGRFLPYDLFVELTIRGGKIYVDSKEVKNAVQIQNREKFLQVDFVKGKADNPKVNAILLVNGGAAKNTHQESFKKFQRLLIKLEEERRMQKELEASFFQENNFEFDDQVDGSRFWNQFLGTPYRFEFGSLVVLAVYYFVLPK